MMITSLEVGELLEIRDGLKPTKLLGEPDSAGIVIALLEETDRQPRSARIMFSTRTLDVPLPTYWLSSAGKMESN